MQTLPLSMLRNRFEELYYPHFPILERTICVKPLYQTSPFLFWTIIVVVVSRQVIPGHAELFKGLYKPYMIRLRLDSLAAPLPLETIQALSYLIMWPLYHNRTSQDPSWLYCGLATNSALYTGLHQARPSQPPLRCLGVVATSMRSRMNTWLGSFLASS